MYPDKLDNTCEENRVIPHYDLSIPRGVTMTPFAHKPLDDSQLGQALPYMAGKSKEAGISRYLAKNSTPVLFRSRRGRGTIKFIKL
jgi:hypothetical protein